MAVRGVGHSLDVEQFLSRAGLTSDSVNKVCSDDHILEISSFLTNWELVANHLGLQPPQIEVIKHDASNNLQLKRLKTLQKWKTCFVFDATYRKLLEALLKNGSTDLVVEVCRLLNPNLGMLSVLSYKPVITLHTDSIRKSLVVLQY